MLKSFPKMENISFKNFFGTILVHKIYLVLIFLVLTPVALTASIFSLIAYSNTKQINTEKVSDLGDKNGMNLYAALPSELPSISGYVISSDARVEILHQFMSSQNSPLTPYAKFLVTTADKYQLDYRLLPAIAMKESGLCRVIPEGSHNCWGWGIHSKGTLSFDSYEEAIETVSKGLKENYVDIGLVTVEEIMSKYIPHSPGGIWAVNVSSYMHQIK
jgi:hypothetical protein